MILVSLIIFSIFVYYLFYSFTYSLLHILICRMLSFIRMVLQTNKIYCQFSIIIDYIAQLQNQHLLNNYEYSLAMFSQIGYKILSQYIYFILLQSRPIIYDQNKIMKILIVLLSLALIANIIVSLVLGHSTHYNPRLKAYFSGLMASILGLFALGMFLLSQNFAYGRKVYLIFSTLLIIISALAIGFEFALGFYFGGWACIVWILIAFVILWWEIYVRNSLQAQNIAPKTHKQQLIQHPILIKSNNSMNQNPLTLQGAQNDLNTGQKKCCSRQKCSYCWHGCCSITTLLIMILFTGVAIGYYANLSQFPLYGNLIQIYDSDTNQNINLHGYCQGNQHATRPTIFLQHGGGSNSMAFASLANILSTKNWKVCTYDRLGYGRSSPIIVSATIQKRAEITSKVINKLTQKDTNKKIIIGGWSAGVELSQIYRKIYPTNVHGMIFLDGYPDYLLLTAIKQGKSQKIQPNVAGVTGILRFLEPLGLGYAVGANQIEDKTLSNYYKGYYQTGYFWQSQYFDVANPYTTTDWLTTAAGTDTKPYPNSQLDLNWPDINVPLLVMPANQTVSVGQSSSMYLQQSQKYIDKCTNANKLLNIMKGDHGFVLQYPDTVAAQIDNFFSPLF